MRKIDYSKKTTSQLLKLAQKHFNAFIRKRDFGKPCINCGKYRPLQAGHLYSVGAYPGMRFDEMNIHGECVQCNYFQSERHAVQYIPHLMQRIGLNEYGKLVIRAEMSKRTFRKFDRFTLIEIIEKYRNLK